MWSIATAHGYINIIGFLIKRVRSEKKHYKLFDNVDSLEKKILS